MVNENNLGFIRLGTYKLFTERVVNICNICCRSVVNKLCLNVLAGVSGREDLFNFICDLVSQSTAVVMSGRFLHFMGLLSNIIMSSYTQCAYKIQPPNQFEPKSQGLYVRMVRLNQVSWVGSDLTNTNI